MTTTAKSNGAQRDLTAELKTAEANFRAAEAAVLLAQNNGTLPEPEPASWAALGDLIGPIVWNWQNWLPAGLLTMLVSESGTGKSALALRIAACYLTGANWPDGTSFTGKPGRVVWAEAESAQAINFDRARQWGLPLDKLMTPFPDPLQDFNLFDPAHMTALYQVAELPDVKLIIVDSLSGAGNDADRPEVKDAVKALAELAKLTGKPVLLTHHLRKRGILDGDTVNLDRVRGSSKVTQFGRVIWALDRPDGASDARRLSVIKNNLGRFANPIGLTISETGIAFGDAPEPPKIETQTDKAIDIMQSKLRRGPVAALEMETELEAANISQATWKRAKGKIGVVSLRAADGRWSWALPAKDAIPFDTL